MKNRINLCLLKLQLIIVVLMFLFINCDRNEQFPSPDQQLLGTVWKLEGFNSADTNTLIIPQPVSKYNYLLFLESNGKAYGKSSVNHMAGKYKYDEEKQTVSIDMQILTDALDTPDGVLYIERLSKIFRYELQDNILRLYYSEEAYLQYSPSKDDTSFPEDIPGFQEIQHGN